MKKIALFGGSFNPIHKGHLQIANSIISKKIVNEVWFIPCKNHAFGKESINGEKRMRMIKQAIKNNPHLKVLDIELKSNKTNYTCETVRKLKKIYPYEFSFITGADNLKRLENWRGFKYLNKNIKFIIVKRPGYNKKVSKNINVLYVLRINNKISSTQIRQLLKKRLPVGKLIPKSVQDYIRDRGIY